MQTRTRLNKKIGSLDRFQSLVLLYTLVQHDAHDVDFWKLERQTEARRSAIAKLERRRAKQGRRTDSDRTHKRGPQGTPQAPGIFNDFGA